MESVDFSNAVNVLFSCLEAGIPSNDLGALSQSFASLIIIDWLLTYIYFKKPPATRDQEPVLQEFLEAKATSFSFLLPVPSFNLTPPNDVLEGLFSSGLYSDFELKFGDTMFKLHSFILSSWEFFNVLKHSNEHDPQTEMPVDSFRFV